MSHTKRELGDDLDRWPKPGDGPGGPERSETPWNDACDRVHASGTPTERLLILLGEIVYILEHYGWEEDYMARDLAASIKQRTGLEVRLRERKEVAPW